MKVKIKKTVLIGMICLLLVVFVLNQERKTRPYMIKQMEAQVQKQLNEEIVLILSEIDFAKDLFISDQNTHHLDVQKINEQFSLTLNTLNQTIQNQTHVNGLPIGSFLNISFLQNRGFILPIRLMMLENVKGNLHFASESLGINNVLLTIFLEIEVKGECRMGFYVSPFHYQQSIPIAVELFWGEVPSIFPYQAK